MSSVSLEATEAELLRRSRQAKAEPFTFAGPQKTLPAWLSLREEEVKKAQAYYTQQLLAFIRLHGLLKQPELKAEEACQHLITAFSLTVQHSRSDRYTVSVPQLSTVSQTQRAVESGVLVLFYHMPTSSTLQVTGGETTQYLALLRALLYLPCTLDTQSWQWIQTHFSQEEKRWQEEKTLSSEASKCRTQWEGLHCLTFAKYQLLQQSAYQKRSLTERRAYLDQHLVHQGLQLMRANLAKHSVPTPVAERALSNVKAVDASCRTVLGKVNEAKTVSPPDTEPSSRPSTLPPKPPQWTPLTGSDGRTAWVEEEDDAEEKTTTPIAEID